MNEEDEAFKKEVRFIFLMLRSCKSQLCKLCNILFCTLCESREIYNTSKLTNGRKMIIISDIHLLRVRLQI